MCTLVMLSKMQELNFGGYSYTMDNCAVHLKQQSMHFICIHEYVFHHANTKTHSNLNNYFADKGVGV